MKEIECVLRCILSASLLYKTKSLNLLIDKYGNAESVYGLSGEELKKFLNIGDDTLKRIFSKQMFDWAKEEIDWAASKGINLLFRGESDYPKLLMECCDAPLMLYYKGNANLNVTKSVAIVGTRLASSYGKDCCERIIKDILPFNPLVISGLAYGIDVCIHKEAIKKGLRTVAVLPNGLDSIYPSSHRNIAAEMLKEGGLITEFPRGMKAQKINFIKRNRIIAGIAQAVVIVESRVKGGAMITVEYANMYNRDVFALPGRFTDSNSFGCNYLISKNVAAIYNSSVTIPSSLGWGNTTLSEVGLQPELFSFDINKKEKILLSLNPKTAVSVENLCISTGFDFSTISMLLLELELEGLVQNINGCGYCLRK